jgi:hypothetical protein
MRYEESENPVVRVARFFTDKIQAAACKSFIFILQYQVKLILVFLQQDYFRMENYQKLWPKSGRSIRLSIDINL